MIVNIDQPFLESDLSSHQGFVSSPKDFHWLEKSIPCQNACPARTDVPSYLAAIASGDATKAYRINLRDNVFPAVLGRICTRPCEKSCRHGYEGLGSPVAICFAKRSAADFATSEHQILQPLFPPTGKKITIVGSGPAGLTAARELSLLGHSVTVYEKYHSAGGMLTQNIPPFRLPREIVKKEIEQIEQQGVTIQCNIEVGRDIPVKHLMKDNDAVILSGGCMEPTFPQLDGLKSKGVFHGSAFLRSVIEEKEIHIGKRVIVIGGGFTAVDCARTAIRMGAEKVSIFYRRQKADMNLTPGEFEAMTDEGIEVHLLASPKNILTLENNVTAVQFILNTSKVASSPSSKSTIEEVIGSECIIPADTLIFATGQRPATNLLQEILKESDSKKNREQTQVQFPFTPEDSLFVAGDQGTGSSSVIEAVASAIQCAELVDVFLMGKRRVQAMVSITSGRSQHRTAHDDEIPRQNMPHLSPEDRNILQEVELGYSSQTAQRETSRCYLCHYSYTIDTSRCIYCNLCCEVKPLSDCILKVRALEQDEEHRIHSYLFPSGQLTPENQFVYRINPAACIRCNRCLEICPVNCIEVQEVSLKKRVLPD